MHLRVEQSTAQKAGPVVFPDPALPVADFTGPVLTLFWLESEQAPLQLPFRLTLGPGPLGPSRNDGFWEEEAVRFNSFQNYIGYLWWDPKGLLELWQAYLRQVRQELARALGAQRSLYLLVPTLWEPGVSRALSLALDQVLGVRSELVVTASVCHLFSALVAGWGQDLGQDEETDCRVQVARAGPDSEYHLFGLRREGERLRTWFLGCGLEQKAGPAKPAGGGPSPAAQGYQAMLVYLADSDRPRVDLDTPLDLGLYGYHGEFILLPEATPDSRGWLTWLVEPVPGLRPAASLAARPRGARDEAAFPLGRLSLGKGECPLRLALKWLSECRLQARLEPAQGGESVEGEFYMPRLCR